MKTVYFHGLPGGQPELALTRVPHLTCPNRNVRSFDELASSLPRGELHLVGFSMGAQAALRMAARLGDRVIRVTLASPVVPPALGGCVPSYVEAGGIGAKLSPVLAAGGIAKTIRSAEPALFRDRDAAAALKAAIKTGLTANATALKREQAAFETPWESALARIRCQVSIWHGEADRFAKPETASALARSLAFSEVNWCAKAGHYATLVETVFALSKHPDFR